MAHRSTRRCEFRFRSIFHRLFGTANLLFLGPKLTTLIHTSMMSGGPGLNFNTMSDLVQNNTAAVAREVGCVQEGGDSQSAGTLECLRKADANLLTNISVKAMRTARPPFGEGFFYPTYDNDFITGRPSELVRSGKVVKNIPTLSSWVSNDGAWYAPPTTSSDEDVLSSFGLWLTGLSELTKSTLLELYPVSDFEHMVRPELDGPISPQYYRAAQLNRDLWFTCPVLDFAWQYQKQSRSVHVRLYEHNATRFTAAYAAMGVPMWRVAHLSDIPYVLNVQHLTGMGTDNSAEQLAEAEVMSRDIARFVTSELQQDQSWPLAFGSATGEEMSEEFPTRLVLKIFGGPHRNSHVAILKNSETIASDAEAAVEWEKLFARCEFINSQQVRQETGV